MPVNITCPATRRGCAYDREGGFGAGLWESATPREDGWMERWHWRLGTEEEYNRTRDALGAWRWRAACEICRMTSPADVATPAQLCARFAEARVRRSCRRRLDVARLLRRARPAPSRHQQNWDTLPRRPQKEKVRDDARDACATSLRLAFLRDDYLWGDGAILPNATCTALAGQDLAVLDKCGDTGGSTRHGRGGGKQACRDDVVDRAHWAS